MKSPGRKIEYLCSKCESPKIQKVDAISGFRNVGVCAGCRAIFPWRKRVKVSLKVKK